MSNLPVREMVLYKHGVGFFVREGEVEGTSATLTFRADEVNDILKSLAVFDRSGGQVYGVHYQTPMDKFHRLANTSINLTDSNSATQLIQQLRGRDATLLIENAKGTEMSYTGRIIGIEQQQHDNGQRYFITMKLTDGMVRVFPFDRLRGFNIKDEQSEQDLSYFLDTSMSEDNRRGVTVRLSEGEHDLVVYYVAPSPTWRVSYRLVAETDEDGNTGNALLQGWGLFDNRLEEDLENVRVTLVAGQPISFIYDLYESKIPDRPTIKDEARTVEKPVEYKSTQTRASSVRRSKPASGAVMNRLTAPQPAMSMSASADDIPDWLQESAPEGLSVDEQMATVTGSADTSQGGTTFQYTVNAPVSVKRGESALVPIINEKIPYQRELLYNGNKFPKHPVASLRFENQSGLTLERGPVTVIEDNDYVGEAIIPFVGDNRTVYIPYAVELGVTVKEEQENFSTIRGLGIDEKFLTEQIYLTSQVNYTIENTTDADKVVTIESAKRQNYDLHDTPDPDVDLLNERRWHVDVPANERVTFTKTERRIKSQQFVIRGLTMLNLKKYMDNKYLDDALLDDLMDILNTMQSIKDIQKDIDELIVEKDELWVKQEEFRRNMKALGTTGKEGTLRLRVVDQLEESQNRIEAIEAEIAELKEKIVTTEKLVDEKITQLSEDYPAESDS